jgi:hypothetical protein
VDVDVGSAVKTSEVDELVGRIETGVSVKIWVGSTMASWVGVGGGGVEGDEIENEQPVSKLNPRMVMRVF